ncbi:exopolyphosphatase / guanosine-5'-triphosphate,3'-diphosphate pyrophosphatase [Azospirillaceae bacterium]
MTFQEGMRRDVDVRVNDRWNDNPWWPTEKPEQSYFAALDLGTNNCRLLIAQPFRDGFRVVDAFSRIVRLGEGLSQSDCLSEAAIERALSALRVCSGKLQRHPIISFRAVATEACRRALNRLAFLERVNQDTGITIDIISSIEEGRLALTGCWSLLNPSLPRALVFDIGGGSTEVMWLKVFRHRPPTLIDQISVRRGVVNLAERHGGDRVPESTYETMINEVMADLIDFDQRNGIRQIVEAGGAQMLGTSGTVTTLAGVNLGLMRYRRSMIDGSFLSIKDARAVSRRLLSLNFAQRAIHPCIGRDRADLVIAGCAVLEALCQQWPFQRLRIADRGLREGILAELIGQKHSGAQHSSIIFS